MSLPKEKEQMKTDLCRILHKIGAFEFGAFKLASGRTSPYYIDLRIIPSFPDAFQRISNLYMKLIKSELGTDSFERIAGIPLAGLPLGALVALQLEKPFLYIRPRAKVHGRQRLIEGIIMPGDRVLMIDDLITTGSSLRKAVVAVRAEGGVVNSAAVLLDREEGGKERLAKDNVTLHFVMKASEAADKLYEIGAITEEQFRIILKQAKPQ